MYFQPRFFPAFDGPPCHGSRFRHGFGHHHRHGHGHHRPWRHGGKHRFHHGRHHHRHHPRHLFGHVHHGNPERGSFSVLDDCVKLSVGIAAARAADIKVEVDAGVLRIMKVDQNETNNHPQFEREFHLDQACLDTSKITAHLSDGLLVVTIPKKEKEAVQVVKVTESPNAENDGSQEITKRIREMTTEEPSDEPGNAA